MRVAGLDLSLSSTGLAIVDDTTATLTRIKSDGHDDDTWAERHRRLHNLRLDLLIAVGTVDLLVIEGPAPGSGAARRARGVHDRAGFWWLVYDAFANDGTEHLRPHNGSAGTPIAVVPPSTRAQYATGRGNAGKDEVLAAVVRRYLDVDVTGNDVADALVLAAMGARWLGQPIDDPPKTHLAAIAKAAWPERAA